MNPRNILDYDIRVGLQNNPEFGEGMVIHTRKTNLNLGAKTLESIEVYGKNGKSIFDRS